MSSFLNAQMVFECSGSFNLPSELLLLVASNRSVANRSTESSSGSWLANDSVVVSELASHSEIQNVDFAKFVELCTADRVVARLHVTMQVANVVQILQRFESLESATQRARNAQRLLRSSLTKILEGFADERHDHIVERAVSSLVLNLAKVTRTALRQLAEHKNFHFEHLHLLGDPLDFQSVLASRVVAQVDGSAASFSQLLHDRPSLNGGSGVELNQLGRRRCHSYDEPRTTIMPSYGKIELI